MRFALRAASGQGWQSGKPRELWGCASPASFLGPHDSVSPAHFLSIKSKPGTAHMEVVYSGSDLENRSVETEERTLETDLKAVCTQPCVMSLLPLGIPKAVSLHGHSGGPSAPPRGLHEAHKSFIDQLPFLISLGLPQERSFSILAVSGFHGRPKGRPRAGFTCSQDIITEKANQKWARKT